MSRSRWISGCVTFRLWPKAEAQFAMAVVDPSKKEWRQNWYFIRTNSISPHLSVPSAPAERLAHSWRLNSQEAMLTPAILHLTELQNAGLSEPMIVGDFIQRGIAPLKHRNRPLWELNQVCGSVPWKKFHMTTVHQTICMSFL